MSNMSKITAWEALLQKEDLELCTFLLQQRSKSVGNVAQQATVYVQNSMYGKNVDVFTLSLNVKQTFNINTKKVCAELHSMACKYWTLTERWLITNVFTWHWREQFEVIKESVGLGWREGQKDH